MSNLKELTKKVIKELKGNRDSKIIISGEERRGMSHGAMSIINAIKKAKKGDVILVDEVKGVIKNLSKEEIKWNK